MKTKKILLDNALESWSIAVKYCKDIQNGLATLHYQKTFVSSLHNAIELLLKQIMLDNNDYSVITNVTVVDEEDAKLQFEFYKSKNLNDFFIRLSDEQRIKFHSIEFSYLIQRKNSLLSTYFNEFNDKIKEIKKRELTEALKLINNLRNNETHFYISKNNYLSEKDFVILHNLMINVYEIMQKYKLLPFFGEPWNEYKHLEFKTMTINSFSLDAALRSSPITKHVKEVLSQKELFFYSDSTYDLTEQYFDELIEENRQSLYAFNEIFSIITMMNQYDLINFHRCTAVPLDSTDKGLSNPKKGMLTPAVYKIRISFNF